LKKRLALTIIIPVVLAMTATLLVILPTIQNKQATLVLKTRPPIIIRGDEDFTPENGVVRGSGTPDDPYIIEGWYIDAPEGGGIVIMGATKHFIIRNCIIISKRTPTLLETVPVLRWRARKFNAAILLSSVQNGKIVNNTVINGILWLQYTDNIVIMHNTVAGISLFGSNNTIISYNKIVEGYVKVAVSYKITFSYNRIEDGYFSIEMHTDYINFVGNEFIRGGLFSILPPRSTIANNTVNGKPLVYLRNVRSVVIDNAGQVFLENCDNITIRNLYISDTLIGIALFYTNNTRIVNNTIINCDTGVRFYKSFHNIIMYNNIVNNLVGISLSDSSSNTIVYNTVTNNFAGIGLSFSNNNVIMNNNIINNDKGISIPASNERNIIAHNNFINNTMQVEFGFDDNSWDLGYPAGGNYWSDHVCTDLYSGEKQDQPGSDGICDKPYGGDRYPLAKPVETPP